MAGVWLVDPSAEFEPAILVKSPLHNRRVPFCWFSGLICTFDCSHEKISSPFSSKTITFSGIILFVSSCCFKREISCLKLRWVSRLKESVILFLSPTTWPPCRQLSLLKRHLPVLRNNSSWWGCRCRSNLLATNQDKAFMLSLIDNNLWPVMNAHTYLIHCDAPKQIPKCWCWSSASIHLV